MVAFALAQVGTSELPLDVQVDVSMAWFDMIVSGLGMALVFFGGVVGMIRGEFAKDKKKTSADSVGDSPKKAKVGTIIAFVGCMFAVTSVLQNRGPSASKRWRTHVEAAQQEMGRFNIDAAAVELHAAMIVLDQVNAEDLRRGATLMQLGAIDQHNGDFADAATKFERVERILARSPKAMPKRRLEVAALLAGSHLAASNLARVSEIVERATALAESSGITQSAQLALILCVDGMNKLLSQELDAAEATIMRSIAIAEADAEGIAGIVGRCRSALALWHYLRGDVEIAIVVYRQSIDEMRDKLPPQNSDLQGAWVGLREALIELGRTDEAAEAARHITTLEG